MATYINYGLDDESDAVLQGAEWLRKVIVDQQSEEAEAAFYAKFQELYLEAQQNPKRYEKLMGEIFDLFLEHCTDLFSVIPSYHRTEEKTKEVESFFAIVMHLLLMLDDGAHLETSTLKLCDLFGGSDKDNKEVRLRLLMWLYNTFNNPGFPLRFKVFRHILDYAAKAELFDQLVPYLEHLHSWMVDWNITMEEKRKLYKDIQTHMRAMGKKTDAFEYLKKYVLLFQGDSDKDLKTETVQQAAIQLVKDAIELPAVFQFDDVLSLDAVKALRKEAKHKELVALCDIFLAGSVDELRKFQEKNKKLFEEQNLSFDDAMSKIRLLTLASLAQGKSEIALVEIATALQEETDQVERWVVKAISEDVIDGRIDQLSQKVLVKSAFQRKFGKDEWQFLDGKLESWIENLESLIKLVGLQKEREKMAGLSGA